MREQNPAEKRIRSTLLDRGSNCLVTGDGTPQLPVNTVTFPKVPMQVPDLPLLAVPDALVERHLAVTIAADHFRYRQEVSQ